MKQPNPIEMFFHCADCIRNDRRDDLAVGLDAEGTIIVWCETCDSLVGRLSAEVIERMKVMPCGACGKERSQ